MNSPDSKKPEAAQPEDSPGATKASAQSGNLPEGGKILPPNSPVEVPRMPAPAPKPEVEPDLSDPHGHKSSWADSTSAEPHKTSVRTSINNG